MSLTGLINVQGAVLGSRYPKGLQVIWGLLETTYLSRLTERSRAWYEDELCCSRYVWLFRYRQLLVLLREIFSTASSEMSYILIVLDNNVSALLTECSQQDMGLIPPAAVAGRKDDPPRPALCFQKTNPTAVRPDPTLFQRPTITTSPTQAPTSLLHTTHHHHNKCRSPHTTTWQHAVVTTSWRLHLGQCFEYRLSTI